MGKERHQRLVSCSSDLPGTKNGDRGEVPEANLQTSACREEELPIGAEAQSRDELRIALQGAADLPCFHVHNLNVVGTGACHKGRIGREYRGATRIEQLQCRSRPEIFLVSQRLRHVAGWLLALITLPALCLHDGHTLRRP